MLDRVLTNSRVLEGKTAQRIFLSFFFLFATFLGAYIFLPLPFTPVPITFQTFFVLTGAAWLGRRWSTGVQATYLGLGAAGVMVFAGGAGGAAVMLGPTAGYLWAFLPVSLFLGKFFEKHVHRSVAAKLAAFALADAFILIAGTAWLGLLLNLDPLEAFLLGTVPFLPGEAGKVVLATLASPRSNG